MDEEMAVLLHEQIDATRGVQEALLSVAEELRVARAEILNTITTATTEESEFEKGSVLEALKLVLEFCRAL